LPLIELDTEQMRRVLINLIENGIDASGKKGQITISTHTSDDTTTLSVIDTGPGVPIEDRARIFQPYVSTKESGMGLGLAVVRSIIEDHGGHISVTNAPTGGAQFDIQIPIPEHAVQQLEEQP
ncbi:MAG: ATP-binding protein, partial [Candidatus Latescibacteria bacterium]|nr:ATP-binding protein [Candidatus Latescibacterota bacterium]